MIRKMLPNSHLSRSRNAVLFVLLAAIWGGQYSAVEVGLKSFPPVLYAALRFDIAALLLLSIIVYSTNYWRPHNTWDWIAVASGGILMLGGYNILLNVGQQTVPSAIAAILAGLIPLFTIAFSAVFFPDEKFGMSELFGILLGFIGLIVLIRPDLTNLFTSDLIGQLILVLAAASFALGAVVTQWVDSEMPIAAQTAWAMLLGAIFVHIATIVIPNESFAQVQWSSEGILALVYLGVLSSAVAYLIYFSLLPQLGSIEINLVAYVSAVFGVVFGWLLFADPVNSLTIVGFLFILIGFGLLKRDELWHEYMKAHTTNSLECERCKG